MRLLVLSGLFVVCVSFSSATASQVATAQEADNGKSGTEFVGVCSAAGEVDGDDPQRMQRTAM